MEFQNKAPEWGAVGIEPSDNLKSTGFVAGYKPPAQIFNFLFNRISASITELQNVSVPKVKLTSESLDTVKDEGLYYAAAGNTVTGKPSGVNAFGLAVIKVSDTDYAQVLYSGGNTQFRFFNSTAWRGWNVYAKQADLTAHTNNKSNPHGVTAAQIGAATTSALSSHTGNKSNPHAVTKAQVGLGSVDNTADMAKPVSTAQATAIADAKKAGTDAQTNLNTHTANKSNPHAVTKSQVGLGNVPNVATNNQTPTYTVAGSNAALASGETLSVAFGKIAKAISSLISHLANKSNPHGVTTSQIGAATASSLTTHIGDKNNPHGVTPEQIDAVSRTRCRIVKIGGSFWSDTAPYTYTWNSADIKATDRPIVSCGVPYTLDAESFENAMRNFNRIDYAEVADGYIKFYCYTERPGNTFLFIKY